MKNSGLRFENFGGGRLLVVSSVLRRKKVVWMHVLYLVLFEIDEGKCMAYGCSHSTIVTRSCYKASAFFYVTSTVRIKSRLC